MADPADTRTYEQTQNKAYINAPAAANAQPPVKLCYILPNGVFRSADEVVLHILAQLDSAVGASIARPQGNVPNRTNDNTEKTMGGGRAMHAPTA